MVDVFVSYASEDRELVGSLVTVLEQQGWKVWWDRRIDIGAAYDSEIEKAIDSATCVVVVWTVNSIDSRWVRTEANEGLERECLVPIAIDGVKPPLAFRSIQTIDYKDSGFQETLITTVGRFCASSLDNRDDKMPFVGRTQEKNLLEEHMIRAREGRGSLVLLSGEAGVGKTRLTFEAAESARKSGFLVLSGRCVDMDGAPPYQPLVEQIEQAVKLAPADNLRRALGENAPEVAILLPELRQVYDDIPQPVSLPPDQERRYLLRGIEEFIRRGGEIQPMLLVFEDLHWAEESTCILLRQLAERMVDSRVLMIGTYRDNELDPRSPFTATLRELNRARVVEDICLTRFDRDGVQKLLQGRAGKTPPEELVELVFSETEGNPFFVEELFRHMSESGKLLDDEGEFIPGVRISETEVPRGVRLIIGERLERVSDVCRQVLTLGAVVGRIFSYDLLLLADAKLNEDEALDAIEEALAANLIEDLSKSREARYGFVHEQIRQTLVSTLSFPRRQRMHLWVAEALQQMLGDSADKQASTIAHHLYQAGAGADLDKTIYFLSKAAERAADTMAFENAVNHLDAAISVLDDDDNKRLAELLGRKAMALQGATEIEKSLAVLDEAIGLSVEQTQKDHFIFQRCRMLLDIWRGRDAVGDLEMLLQRARKGEDQHKQLELERWMARAYYVLSLDNSGYAEKTRDAYESTIELARELGESKILAMTLVQTTQLVDYWSDFIGEATKNLEEAESIARSTGDEDIEIDVATARLSLLGDQDIDELSEQILTKLLARRDLIRLNAHYFRMMWSKLGSGNLSRCVEICDAGIELAYRIGTLPVQYPTIKAMALMEMGQFEQAWKSIEEEIADEEHRFGAALQALAIFQYEINTGSIESAVDRCAHVIGEAKVLNRVWMLRWVSAVLARVQALYIQEAEMLETLNRLIDDTGMHPGAVGKAAMAIANGDFEEAARMLEKRTEMEMQLPHLRNAVSAIQMQSEAHMHDKKFSEALQKAEIGITLCESHNMQFQLWQLLAVKSRACAELGQREASESAMKEARLIHSIIADTIPQEDYRRNFVDGKFAQMLRI